LFGFISDVDGRRSLRGNLELQDPVETGRALAARLRDQGATEILAGLSRQTGVPSPQPE